MSAQTRRQTGGLGSLRTNPTSSHPTDHSQTFITRRGRSVSSLSARSQPGDTDTGWRESSLAARGQGPSRHGEFFLSSYPGSFKREVKVFFFEEQRKKKKSTL